MNIRLRQILPLISRVPIILRSVIDIVIELLGDDDDRPNAPTPSVRIWFHKPIASTDRAGEFIGMPDASLVAS